MLKNRGLQHIGVPVGDLEKAVGGYQQLGFGLKGRFDTDDTKCAFVEMNGVSFELYETPESSGQECGQIAHVALDVEEIESAYNEAKEQGLKLETGIECLPHMWEKGCKYFLVKTESGELIEYNQIL